ncbi:MAG: phage head closure protein [Chloroflexota bacterium]|nr:phage head closure protein [Chloroflexota bacterium]
MTLSSADLAYVRSQAAVALPDTITIERLTRADDGAGGQTETWTIAYADVPARLSERTGREGIMAARESVEADWVLTLPYDQDITEADRIIHASLTYEVVFVNTGRSYDTVRRCFLARIA